MSEFLSILVGYYLCNSVAVSRLLSLEEAATCNTIYEAVKAHFVPAGENRSSGLEARIARNRVAYKAFKSWEEANFETVCEMKRTANETAGLTRLAACE